MSRPPPTRRTPGPRGAALMQAIARVNRTFKDKPAGLVVDYLGIAEDLRSALADYTTRDQDNQDLGQDLREQAVPDHPHVPSVARSTTPRAHLVQKREVSTALIRRKIFSSSQV